MNTLYELTGQYAELLSAIESDEVPEEAISDTLEALGALSEDLRNTVALVLDDVTHAQAAEILGVSEGTISWRMSEAKKRLKEIKELSE